MCTRYGSVLIFDEVMTGFRVAAGGVQESEKITPDLPPKGAMLRTERMGSYVLSEDEKKELLKMARACVNAAAVMYLRTVTDRNLRRASALPSPQTVFDPTDTSPPPCQCWRVPPC